MKIENAIEKLNFAVFEFVLLPNATIQFPPFKGNVFRGALGKTLRHLTCAFKGDEKLVTVDAGHNFSYMNGKEKVDETGYWMAAWFIQTLKNGRR
ncbi:MAG: hypothetical protein GY757_45190 [bacterium]|nr:hypothetical protein [bacterium]